MVVPTTRFKRRDQDGRAACDARNFEAPSGSANATQIPIAVANSFGTSNGHQRHHPSDGVDVIDSTRRWPSEDVEREFDRVAPPIPEVSGPRAADAGNECSRGNQQNRCRDRRALTRLCASHGPELDQDCAATASGSGDDDEGRAFRTGIRIFWEYRKNGRSMKRHISAANRMLTPMPAT
jgi:hypothetical protein